ncbi:MAG: hypothetical protein EOP01_06265 [Propionibacteriaceae bacterium]|nr:MAG: hypothetical protein EOP01_06265 [Propionibacteriaceae bacterium]
MGRALALVVAVGILTGAGYALGYRLNLQTRAVPVPTAAASPDEVVRAYVEAYNARDFSTMGAIYPSGQPAYSRLHAMGTMKDVRIVRSRPATADDLAGMSLEPGRDHFLVEVRLTYVGLTGSDLAYRPGPNGWTYWLERADTGAWTIIDHGNG